MNLRRNMTANALAAAFAFGAGTPAFAQSSSVPEAPGPATTNSMTSSPVVSERYDFSDPYFQHEYLMGLAALALALCVWSRRRGNKGSTLRYAAAAMALGAMAHPQVIKDTGDRDMTEALIVIDRSASQQFGNRMMTADEAEKQLRAGLSNIPGLNARILNITENADGTRMMDKIEEALSDVPFNRRGGIFIVSDGQVHDQIRDQASPDDKTPVHFLRTGQDNEYDRRIEFEPFERAAQIKKQHEIKFRVIDEGPVPATGDVRVSVLKDGQPVTSTMVKPGETASVPVEIDHAGANVIEIRTDEVTGEVTARNNKTLTSVNGIMPKMNILLATGKINENTPAFRKMFNADSSVNIVPFAVARSPDKIDKTPAEELALRPFPYEEIFSDNLKLFNLIIIDSTSNLKLLPPIYMQRLVDYVKNGGALLIAAGPELNDTSFLNDIYGSLLKEVLPAQRGTGVHEEVFKPRITERGQRHPAMRHLPGANPPDPKAEAAWGPWYRQIDITAPQGEVVMEGIDKKPLMLLSPQGKGRVALLTSDSLWRWDLAAEGEKGPYAELIGQVSHWLMKNPEFDEESLKLVAGANDIEVVLQTMGDSAKPVTVQFPSGKTETVMPQPNPQEPGLWKIKIPAAGIGSYSAQAADKTGPVAYSFIGQENPREFADITATDKILKPLVERTGGGMASLTTGPDGKVIIPEIRFIPPAPTGQHVTLQGSGWLGVQMTDAITNRRTEKRHLIDPAILAGSAGLLLALSYLHQAGWRNPFRREKPSSGPSTPKAGV